MLKRCQWVTDTQIDQDYHDQEWGAPIYDKQKLFEFLILEGMQAGLSWITILKKRENYRIALDHFDPDCIALYDETKIASLLKNSGIIRNRLKIHAIINNAQCYQALAEQGVDFSAYLWSFVDGKPIKNQWLNYAQIPTTNTQAKAMAKSLKSLGFKFVGETICYAFMQAVGMVNDHTTDCFRYEQV